MKEYSISLNCLLNEYTKSQLQVLYAEARKRELEAFKLQLKAVRAGIAEAFTGKDVVKDINDNEEKSDIDVLQDAGFVVQQM